MRHASPNSSNRRSDPAPELHSHPPCVQRTRDARSQRIAQLEALQAKGSVDSRACVSLSLDR